MNKWKGETYIADRPILNIKKPSHYKYDGGKMLFVRFDFDCTKEGKNNR